MKNLEVDAMSPRHGASLDFGWRRRPPDMVGSCEYIEEAVADSRQGVVLQLGSSAWRCQLTIKSKLVTKCDKELRTLSER
jgi:hypothetical protein